MQKFFRFFIKHNAYLLLLLYCGIGLLFIKLEKVDILSRLRQNSAEFEAFVSDRLMSYSSFWNLKKENEQLLRVNAELVAKNISLQTASRDFYARQKLLSDSTINTQNFKIARVIDRRFSSTDNSLLIDAGSNDGIRPDMSVLTPDGLVGRIVFVSKHYAKVMPVIHPDFKVSVFSDKSGATGLLSWKGGKEHIAQIEHIPLSSHITLNETILTTDFSTFSPRGVPLGRVISIKPDKLFYAIDIWLAVDFSSLTHVLVAPLKVDTEKEEMIHHTELEDKQP
ncbi:rod shape-determining protein MreC [Chlorobium phaeobacteroides]|uniref:Cell shape-determining protein MreC n=1 Tax=Chlorobium phaeobacteroides (strain DSM 266 / SMG 266 / 2430) TaxID=290317 RepID=A1BEP3_CHLPD|nr:rod shape-determining protein MreC [Chlorobium phaeobacteroides]ABL64870.1 Rod shape-determining protein MreC [Chlorobium phaeobacteroides DSM 266]MBV5328584.1 rod shape-determining protein MreC [Chlorobium sp.]